MFHINLFKCIKSNDNDQSIAEPSVEVASFSITLKEEQDTMQRFSLGQLKKKFNSSNERLSHHLRSKLKRKSKKKLTSLVSKEKFAAKISNLKQLKASKSTRFDSNVMSSTVCNTGDLSLRNESVYAINLSHSGFYSENSDISDDSDVEMDEDNFGSVTLKHDYYEESLHDSSLSSLDSLDCSSDSSMRFDPLTSSSKCDISLSSCVDCGNTKPKSMRKEFMPMQTSSRKSLLCAEMSHFNDSSIQVSNISGDLIDSNYFSYDCSSNKNVFSSTLI